MTIFQAIVGTRAKRFSGFIFLIRLRVFWCLGSGSWTVTPQCHILSVISTIETFFRDEVVLRFRNLKQYIRILMLLKSIHHKASIFSLSNSSFGIYIFGDTMGDNIRRGFQDINLGVDEPPVLLPVEVINEAVAENRFILVGRPVMPRRQNIRAIIASLPRIWGQEGVVQGRVIEGRRFQFTFPSEESLNLVLRRAPWTFADRMLIMERWSPSFNPLTLNFIPFWIQIRGIPIQFFTQAVVEHIGRTMGMYLEVDHSLEAIARRDYARVRFIGMLIILSTFNAISNLLLE